MFTATTQIAYPSYRKTVNKQKSNPIAKKSCHDVGNDNIYLYHRFEALFQRSSNIKTVF